MIFSSFASEFAFIRFIITAQLFLSFFFKFIFSDNKCWYVLFIYFLDVFFLFNVEILMMFGCRLNANTGIEFPLFKISFLSKFCLSAVC